MGSVPLYVFVLFILSAQNHQWLNDGHLTPGRVVFVLSLLAWEFCLSAWRCHDFGKPLTWDFWTNQIPVIGGLISWLELHFKPGDNDRNAYGDVPRL